MMKKRRITTQVILAAIFVLVVGCVHGRNGTGGAEKQVRHTYKFLPTGRILSVNPAHQYAIVECVTAPAPGQEVLIYSGTNVRSRLVLTSQIRGVFAAADIIEGAPEKNDLIWMQHVNIVSSDRGEKP